MFYWLEPDKLWFDTMFTANMFSTQKNLGRSFCLFWLKLYQLFSEPAHIVQLSINAQWRTRMLIYNVQLCPYLLGRKKQLHLIPQTNFLWNNLYSSMHGDQPVLIQVLYGLSHLAQIAKVVSASWGPWAWLADLCPFSTHSPYSSQPFPTFDSENIGTW